MTFRSTRHPSQLDPHPRGRRTTNDERLVNADNDARANLERLECPQGKCSNHSQDSTVLPSPHPGPLD